MLQVLNQDLISYDFKKFLKSLSRDIIIMSYNITFKEGCNFSLYDI